MHVIHHVSFRDCNCAFLLANFSECIVIKCFDRSIIDSSGIIFPGTPRRVENPFNPLYIRKGKDRLDLSEHVTPQRIHEECIIMLDRW